MFYFEDFMEAIESLPGEINESLLGLRDLDRQTQSLLEPIDGLIKAFFENCQFSRLSEKEKESEYEAILKRYDEALSYSEKKTEVVRVLYETYNKVVRKLDAELEKFRLELEADNSGVTSKIEHRIHTLLGRNLPGSNRLDKRRTKLRAGHIFGGNRVLSRRRQQLPSDVPERPYFVLKRRFAAFETSPMTLPPVPYGGADSPFISTDTSNALMLDEHQRLSTTDSMHRIPSSESLDSIDQNMEEFDTFHPDGSEYCDPTDDLPIDSNKRSRTLGMPQKSGNPSDGPGRDSQRSIQGYGPNCSPFVPSDNDTLGMNNISGSLAYHMNDHSIDDLLSETRHPRDSLNRNSVIDKLASKSGSPESGTLHQSSSSSTLAKLGVRRPNLHSTSESPRHNWFSACMPSSNGGSGNSDTNSRLVGGQPVTVGGTFRGREKRISRTNRRPIRLGSQTDSNDECLSDHDLLIRSSELPSISGNGTGGGSHQIEGVLGVDDFRKLSHGGSPSAKLPAMKSELAHPIVGGNRGDDDEDEDQERYCFCHEVSYGDMIACDAPSCPYEWFHYACVGLSVAPKGQWFCPACIKMGAVARFGRKRPNKR